MSLQQLRPGTQLGAGSVVQVASSYIGSVIVATTIMFDDDTIPQITEGVQVTSLVFTPKSATNILIIHASVTGSNTIAQQVQVAIFKDAVADALAEGRMYCNAAAEFVQPSVTHLMVAGTTSPITFQVRAGAQGASVFSINGYNGSRSGGGAFRSGLHIMEVSA